ncbi:hypothetical protein E2P86_10380 [Sphingobacterium psychroaquaticum]|uniref:hypothetical protein n=1 Tax=Sphingobacterium psychroaquaticum TaxID=561061 RepID=UPI00106D2616|nr:hypothetical protein [Sphingobacterium psychroaquaticum]QBQ41533.1 hypothetical protein E2P86_10380 [Sphingobacterium psychroaquaticum]
MKKVITAILSLALLTCLIIYSCQKDKEGKVEIENSKLLKKSSAWDQAPGKGGKLGWSPLNSTISEEGAGLAVVASGDWSYVGFDKENNLVKFEPLTKKTITCTCNTSGTCKPFKSHSPFGSTQGCVGTCTNCTMEQSVIQNGRIFDLESGGYFSPLAKTRLLKNGESAPAVFPALLELEVFQKEFSRFMDMAYKGKEIQKPISLPDGSIAAPRGYSLVAVSIMGRGMGVILPDNFVRSAIGNLASSKASCSCSDKGGCSLKRGDIGIAGAYWCEGDCNSCTLTTSRFNGPDINIKTGTYNVQLISYRY